ncbi:hypothetical protein HDF16_001447 [Granulicella aggregans]|uniref:Uncharacterized protein n=1 Tax=Granulicella aggregans TaxID=474949 RepID=A0A7W8E2P7_9BACT|nr:hypothetical protein [Granulicella aggregans]MBB5056762.1 hypothetical protein [Granulicella aggregans]
MQILFGLAVGAIGLALAFALMRHDDTAPSIAFAFFLLFLTLQWISTISFPRDMVPRFVVSSILCMASALWLLRSNFPIFWEHEDEPLVYSITWRSAVVLLVLLATPHCASYLASRSIERFRRRAI